MKLVNTFPRRIDFMEPLFRKLCENVYVQRISQKEFSGWNLLSYEYISSMFSFYAHPTNIYRQYKILSR